MREPRGQGAAGDDGVVGNADQPEVKPSRGEPLITAAWGPVVAAAITAAASLLVFVAGQVRHIDERLDALERKAGVLLDKEGEVKPSSKVIENFYDIRSLNRRVTTLEQRL